MLDGKQNRTIMTTNEEISNSSNSFELNNLIEEKRKPVFYRLRAIEQNV